MRPFHTLVHSTSDTMISDVLFSTDFVCESIITSPFDVNLDRIKEDIKAHDDHHHLSFPCSDIRFGDNALNRIHACAYTHLKLWCAKPSSSTSERFLHHFCTISLSLPLALFDTTINTALLVPHLTILAIYRTVKVFLYFQETQQDPRFIKNSRLCTQACLHSYDHLIENIVMIPYSLFQLLVLNKEPQACIDKREPWSYWVYPMDPAVVTNAYNIMHPTTSLLPHLVLDQNKVKYLRERCGWANISDKQLLTSNIPVDAYTQSHRINRARERISYIYAQNDPIVTVEWTKWQSFYNIYIPMKECLTETDR